jgi:hypothetical protein
MSTHKVFFLKTTSRPNKNTPHFLLFPILQTILHKHPNPKATMPKTLLCFLLLLAPASLIAQEFKTPAAKEAQAKYKAECQKAEAIVTSAEAQYIKDLNKALATAIKEGNTEEANKLKSALGDNVNIDEEKQKNKDKEDPKLAKEDKKNDKDEKKGIEKKTQRKIKVPKLMYKGVDKNGQIREAFRFGTFADAHDRNEIFDFLALGDQSLELKRNKITKISAEADGKFKELGGRDATGYWIFYINSPTKQTCDYELIINAHGSAIVFNNFEEIANLKHQEFENKIFEKIELQQGINVIVIAYKNTWAGRVLDLRIKGVGLKYGN